jgi:hypothetical protein
VSCGTGTRSRSKALTSAAAAPASGGYLNSYQLYELREKVDRLREKLDGSSSLLMAAVYGTGIGAVVLAAVVGAIVRPCGRRSGVATAVVFPEEEELLETERQRE